MAAPQNAPLPPFFTLVNGYTIRITAQDPTTGATVAGVVASNVSLAVDQDDLDTSQEEQKPGEIFLIPGPALLA